MRKTYQLFVALMLCMLGTTTVSAEEISLNEIPFWQHEVWGQDEPKNTQIEVGSGGCAWVLGEATDLPYGASNVNDFADVTAYTSLVVTLVEGTEGSPRFLFNRDADEGQWNAEEAESHLIDNTKGGWSSKYFTQDGNVYTVDIKQLVKDKGYAHLHAIKSNAWGATVTVESMVLVSAGKVKQIGWTSIINNGDFEGDDVSSFPVAQNAVVVSGVQDAVITDGVGVNGSRGLALETLAGATEDWATQLFVKFNESLPEGIKWRFSMDVKADLGATVGSGCHREPRDWFDGGMIPEFNVGTDWTTITAEGAITANQAANLGSIAFDLNRDRDNANTFYFDNIKFEVYKVGTSAEFCDDVILVDFGFDTNIADMIPADSKRVFIDNSCASVKVNGKAVEIYSIEGLEDGRFYIFLAEAADSKDEVLVSLTNNFGLKYISGTNIGEDVPNFSDVATYNYAVSEADGAYPYDYVTPTLITADPEDGSFNLPNSIKDFKLVFDKVVDCAQLVGTLNGNAMTVTPAEGFSKEITLTRQGTGDLPTGEYTLHVTKIYPEQLLAEEIFGDTTIVVSVGKIEYDPNDVPLDLIPDTYFANCASGSIPEGFFVKFGSDDRPAGTSYGSGPRMFDFGGGDFTKGLYYREGYVEFGTTEGYELSLKAGKEYKIHFNTAMWKDSGSKTRFRIMNEFDESVLLQMINNTPNVNGGTGTVTGSTSVDLRFTPEADGNYVLRWESAGDETSDPGWMENLLANVTMKYTPNQIGLEETMMLEEALKKAKATRDANTDERYDGPAFDALKAAIEKYEAEMATYTAPSKFTNAAADLDALREAMDTHHANCDEYDTQVKKAVDVQRQNEMPDGDPAKATKFTKTELFAQLKAILAKYNASSEWVDNAEPGTVDENGEEVHDWQLVYTYDVLKDDAILPAAIAELKDIANLTSLLFTEGFSEPENANGGKGTGVAVWTERLRLGVETLKALGVAEDDNLIVTAKNALTDDDALANKLQLKIKEIMYGQLKEANNTLFEAQIDETTLEEVIPSYDMTVFVKNPNIYKQLTNADFTEENVPGWTTPDGYNKPGLSHGWGAYYNIEGVAEDCMFQTWGGSYRVEQTIPNLPAGVYTIRFAFGERVNDDINNFADSYAYVMNSIAEEFQSNMLTDENGNETYIPGIGQAFPFASNETQCAIVQDVVVTDGELTIGVNGGGSSHTFFNEVRLQLTAPAMGFDYGKAYQDVLEEIESGIDATVAQPAKVRAIELFDLNGRRINSARQGIVFVKKYMSDGTVRTEKVIKK